LIAVYSASEKALQRAARMEGRGYYFDFMEFDSNDAKNNTPSTPCISLIYALDLQLERMFAEGLEARWARHADLADYVREWVTSRGFELFPERQYCSQTLTCSRNSRGIDLAELKKRLGESGFAFDDGYGKIKGETFRIAHMGDMTRADLDELFCAITAIMPELA
jgi:aspartate aminotransferase-like enzyme